MSALRRGCVLIASLVLGCGDDERNVGVSQIGVASESAACGCWNGRELSVVNGCTATLTARIVTLTARLAGSTFGGGLFDETTSAALRVQ